MALKHGLQQEYEREIQITDRVLDRLRGLPLDWRPHEKSRSIAELATHLADVPRWGTFILDRVKFDISALPAPAQARSHNDILRRFREHAASTLALLDRSDAELRAVWWLTRNDAVLFSMPRTTALRRLVLNHLIHHRGQLSVYVRMNDAALPSIYGDTAEEPWSAYAPSTMVSATTSTTGSGGG